MHFKVSLTFDRDPGGFLKRRGLCRVRPSIRVDGSASNTRAFVRMLRG